MANHPDCGYSLDDVNGIEELYYEDKKELYRVKDGVCSPAITLEMVLVALGKFGYENLILNIRDNKLVFCTDRFSIELNKPLDKQPQTTIDALLGILEGVG